MHSAMTIRTASQRCLHAATRYDRGAIYAQPGSAACIYNPMTKQVAFAFARRMRPAAEAGGGGGAKKRSKQRNQPTSRAYA